MRRWWAMGVLLMMVVTACGSNAATTSTGAANDPAAAAVCADMDRPLADTETFPFEATQDTGPHQIGKIGAAGWEVPYWQRVQRDGPPALVAAVTTLIAAIQRGMALTPAQQNGPEADAILNDPSYIAAKQTWDSYISANCPDQTPTPTEARFVPSPEDATICADLNAKAIPNDVMDRLTAESRSPDPTTQNRAFIDGLNALLPHSERVERDAPPSLAAAEATLIDSLQREARIDPTLDKQHFAAAYEAILNQPAHHAAIVTEGDFDMQHCHGITQTTTN